ncbi:hypothetical protein ACCD00_14955 [Pseudomonas sp. Pseusp3]|uniref:hypothetical protein n=1 Tax=Pseudomonas sp. Pseusp3 TaxID=3243029 RepID=UPI0039B0494D
MRRLISPNRNGSFERGTKKLKRGCISVSALSAKKILLSLSIACIPLTGFAATPTNSIIGNPIIVDPNIGSPNPGNPNFGSSASKPFHVSCSTGNFTGEAKGHYFNYGSSKSVYLKEYRITKHNGQSGGNKANVNLVVANFNGGGSKEVKSPDRMKQDGQWNAQDLSVMHAPWSSAQIRVEFIFDKSGSDPRCTSRTNI